MVIFGKWAKNELFSYNDISLRCLRGAWCKRRPENIVDVFRKTSLSKISVLCKLYKFTESTLRRL